MTCILMKRKPLQQSSSPKMMQRGGNYADESGCELSEWLTPLSPCPYYMEERYPFPNCQKRVGSSFGRGDGRSADTTRSSLVVVLVCNLLWSAAITASLTLA